MTGSFTNAPVDSNNDTIKANQVIAGTKGTLGHALYTGIQEGFLDFQVPPCAQGPQIKIISYSLVRRFANGDLLFSRLPLNSFGSGCLDQTFGSTITLDAIVTGGTGRFEGATGGYQITAVTVPLLFAGGELVHGAFEAEVRGTIITTK